MSFKFFKKDGQELQANLIANMPIGSIIDWAADNAPAGWLKCDGSAISRSDYADLFNTIGTSYGTGNGSTTFNLPDINGSIIYASLISRSGSSLLPVADGSVTAAKLAPGIGITRASGATVATTQSSTSTSFVDITGLSVTITPSTSSKGFLIVANLVIGSNAFVISRLRLMRGNTAISTNSFGYTNSFIHDSADRWYEIPMTFLDFPNTTSATTYKIQWLTDANTIYLNRRNTETNVQTVSNISVVEVDPV